MKEVPHRAIVVEGTVFLWKGKKNNKGHCGIMQISWQRNGYNTI